MRVNRNIGIGLGFIALALILVIWLFRRAAGPRPTEVANAPTGEQVSTNAADVTANSGDMAVYTLEEIPERSIVTPDMFEMRPLPTGEPTENAIIDPRAHAVGYVTRTRIPAGTWMRNDDLVGHISKVGLAAAIRPGLRGMVVPVITNPTLHDMVRIGDYVDIVAAFDGQESRTIVQNVRVLAVDVFVSDFPPVRAAQRGPGKAEPRSGPPEAAPGITPLPQATATPGPAPAATPTPAPAVLAPALTLEVSPAQATAISLAQAAGAPIDFLLRPHEAPTEGRMASTGPIVEPRPASISRAEIAPKAWRVRAGNAAAARKPATVTRIVRVPSGGGPGGGTRWNPPPKLPDGGWQPPGPVPTVGPFVPTEPKTYNIPIYADGKLVRTDTVAKPETKDQP